MKGEDKLTGVAGAVLILGSILWLVWGIGHSALVYLEFGYWEWKIMFLADLFDQPTEWIGLWKVLNVVPVPIATFLGGIWILIFGDN